MLRFALASKRGRDYRESMAELKPANLFVSEEEEVQVDAETAAAIELGIREADEGRAVPLEDVRKMIPEWISKFESRQRR